MQRIREPVRQAGVEAGIEQDDLGSVARRGVAFESSRDVASYSRNSPPHHPIELSRRRVTRTSPGQSGPALTADRPFKDGSLS